MFGFLNNINKGIKFDKQVTEDFGIDMVKWLHEAYDTQIKDGTISHKVSYSDYAPQMLKALIDSHKAEKTETQTEYTKLMQQMINIEGAYPEQFNYITILGSELVKNPRNRHLVVEAIEQDLIQRDELELASKRPIFLRMARTLDQLRQIEGASIQTIQDAYAAAQVVRTIDELI